MVKSERVNMINSFRFLAKSGVKEEIINFDARQITSEINAKVSTLVNSKKASFNQKVFFYLSSGNYFYKWIIRMEWILRLIEKIVSYE